MAEADDRFDRLTESQKELVGWVLDRLLKPVAVNHLISQAPFTPDFARIFGEALQLHHALSDRHLSKENFEFAILRALRLSKQRGSFGPSGHAGHDIEANGEKWSLKTQADQGIHRTKIHISKFMELGKGEWKDEASLAALRDRFLHHMQGYDRIFTLRYFRTPKDRGEPATLHEYELVEIPKALFEEAVQGKITMQHTSKQTPKPGYCHVTDDKGAVKYALYFDGGTERKLQIKALDKQFCAVIADWKFNA